MRPLLHSAGLVIAMLLLSFYPVPPTPIPAEIAQVHTVLQRKTEALRQAQLALLQGKVTAKDPQLSSQNASTHSPAANFSHPYYWAPFILIGNSL